VDVLTEELEKYTRSLEGLILPGSLMDCFEYHRRQEMRKAASSFNDNEVSARNDSIVASVPVWDH
jgi:hypothetical protein